MSDDAARELADSKKKDELIDEAKAAGAEFDEGQVKLDIARAILEARETAAREGDGESPTSLEGEASTPFGDDSATLQREGADDELSDAREEAVSNGVIVPGSWTVEQIRDAVKASETDVSSYENPDTDGYDGHDGYRPASPRG